MMASVSAEERAISETDPTGIVTGRQAGRRPPDCIETRNTPTGAVERCAVGVGDKTAEGEGRVDGTVVDAQVNGTDAARRWCADGLQERRPLMELGILTSSGGLVVVAHGPSQGVRWHLEVDGQFLGRRRRESDAKPRRFRS